MFFVVQVTLKGGLKGGSFLFISCWSSPMFWFYNLHGCALPHFLWHSSKWAHWFGSFLQYTSGLEVLACSLNTDLIYVTTMLQLCPSLNHQVMLPHLLEKDAETFWVYSHSNSSSALFWTWDPLLNFQQNA